MQLTVFMPQKVRKVKLLKETVPKSTVIVTSFSYLHFMLCMNLDMYFSWTYVDSCM